MDLYELALLHILYPWSIGNAERQWKRSVAPINSIVLVGDGLHSDLRLVRSFATAVAIHDSKRLRIGQRRGLDRPNGPPRSLELVLGGVSLLEERAVEGRVAKLQGVRSR